MDVLVKTGLPRGSNSAQTLNRTPFRSQAPAFGAGSRSPESPSGGQTLVMKDALERAQGVSVGLLFPRRFGRPIRLTPESLDLLCNTFIGSSMLAQSIARHGAPQAVNLGEE